MSFKNTDVGKIPVEWAVEIIDNLKASKKNAIAMGPFGSKIKKEFFQEEGIPVIRGNNLKPFYFAEEEFVYLSDEKAEEMKSSWVFRKDIVITHRGTLGQVGIIPSNSLYEKYVVSQSGMKLTCDPEKVNSNYLFYYLNSRMGQYHLLMNRSQVGVPAIAQASTALKKIPVPLPELNEQKAIAHILSTLDDKIEVNNQINKTLENMAQAIFKQWFVDFEFPNEDGEPYKSSGGKMVESELGLIPLGWKVHLLKDFVPVITGKKNANVATNSGKYKFFTCSQIASKTDDYSFEGKAILVAGNGDFNVKFYNGKFEAYQRTYVLIPHKEDLSGFIYYMMDYNLEEIVTNARGSVISYLTKGDLEDSKIAFPEKENHIQYTVIFQIINEFILNLNKENEKLSELRDTLLPKLMSGEIRVPLDSEGDVS